MTKRKKDIATYLILGMKKYQIALMLFFELLIIGFLSIFLGIFLGILFLKLFWMFILSLENIDTALVRFYIPFDAIYRTIRDFFILFIILGIFSYFKLWRTKIIGILNKKIPKVKNIFWLIIFSIISLILMFFGYKLAITSSMKDFLPNIFIAVLMVLVGTYLFFSSTLTMYIKIKRKNKFLYYRDLNMVSYANLETKIKENSKSLATITILLTTALIIVITISNIFLKTKHSAKYDYPYNVAYINGTDEQNEAMKNFLETNIKKSKIKDVTSVKSIKTEVLKKDISAFGDVSTKAFIRVISYSSLKQLNFNSSVKSSLTKEPKYEECIEVIKYLGFNERLNDSLSPILFYSTNEYKKVIEVKPNSYIPSGLIPNFVVVNDEFFDVLCKNNKVNTLECLHFIENNKISSEKYNEFYAFRESLNNKDFSISISDEFNNYDIKLFSYGVFSGLTIAIVLLMCTANVIFFKQLSNAEEAKESYRLLKALGAEKNVLMKSVKKESRLIFFCPLFMSIIHSIAALTLFRKTIFINNITPTILSTLLFVFVYLIYYLITVDIYFKIIDKES